MKRISTLTKALDLFGTGKHGFRNGDIATSTPPTDFDASWCNSIQEEIATIIEGAGLVLNEGSNAQLYEAIKRMIDIQAGNYALDTGAANAYVIALDPAIAVYTNGMTVRFRVVNGNTGAATLNAGAGAVPLVNDVGGALVQSDAPAGGIISATYDAGLNKFLINSLVTSQALSQAVADTLYSKINTGKAVGEVFTHTGTTAPAGSIIIPTASTTLSRASYPSLNALYAAQGYPYGAGDGATTFGIPYMAGDESLIQASGNLGTRTAGSVVTHNHTQNAHTHTQDAHAHGVTDPGHVHGLSNYNWAGTYGAYIAAFANAGGGQGAVASPMNAAATGISINNATATNQNATATNNATGGASNVAAGLRVLHCLQYL